jgi:outer membrane protein with glycine zipper
VTRLVTVSLGLAAAVSVSACETPQQQNALVGGALGGGTGALVGSAVSGGSAGGTLAGAAIGATSGAMIGAAVTPQPTYAGGSPPRGCAQWANDYNGNRICSFLLVVGASSRSRDKGTAKASS